MVRLEESLHKWQKNHGVHIFFDEVPERYYHSSRNSDHLFALVGDMRAWPPANLMHRNGTVPGILKAVKSKVTKQYKEKRGRMVVCGKQTRVE